MKVYEFENIESKNSPILVLALSLDDALETAEFESGLVSYERKKPIYKLIDPSVIIEGDIIYVSKALKSQKTSPTVKHAGLARATGLEFKL